MPTRRRAHDDDPASAATELKLFLETKLQPDDYADAEKLIDAMSGAEDEETGLPRPGGAQDHRITRWTRHHLIRSAACGTFTSPGGVRAGGRPYSGESWAGFGGRRCFASTGAAWHCHARDLPSGALPACGASPSAPVKVPAAARHVPRMTPAPLLPSTRSSRAWRGCERLNAMGTLARLHTATSAPPPSPERAALAEAIADPRHRQRAPIWAARCSRPRDSQCPGRSGGPGRGAGRR